MVMISRAYSFKKEDVLKKDLIRTKSKVVENNKVVLSLVSQTKNDIQVEIISDENVIDKQVLQKH